MLEQPASGEPVPTHGVTGPRTSQELIKMPQARLSSSWAGTLSTLNKLHPFATRCLTGASRSNVLTAAVTACPVQLIQPWIKSTKCKEGQLAVLVAAASASLLFRRARQPTSLSTAVVVTVMATAAAVAMSTPKVANSISRVPLPLLCRQQLA